MVRQNQIDDDKMNCFRSLTSLGASGHCSQYLLRVKHIENPPRVFPITTCFSCDRQLAVLEEVPPICHVKMEEIRYEPYSIKTRRRLFQTISLVLSVRQERKK